MLDVECGTTTAHDLRIEFLDSLSVLAGYAQKLDCGLPDGRRPDILRIDLKRQRLFIGDAKDSESPKDLNTGARLLAYFRWLSTHVVARGGRGTVAICFGNARHVRGWTNTLRMLSQEAGIAEVVTGVERFGTGFFVAWCDASSPQSSKANPL